MVKVSAYCWLGSEIQLLVYETVYNSGFTHVLISDQYDLCGCATRLIKVHGNRGQAASRLSGL